MKYRSRSIVTSSINEMEKELKKEILYLSFWGRPRKILFDHLPKCGGSSLQRYLESHYPKRKTFTIPGINPRESVAEFRSFPLSTRHGYDLVKGHLANQLIEYCHPECLKVTVLRDPVDRIISHYYYAKRSPEHYLYSHIHEAKMSLDDYVSSGLTEELRNWYTTHFSGLTVQDAEGDSNKAINRAIEMVQNNYDIIGFLDNFAAFSDALRDQARLRYKYGNLKANVTNGRVAINDVQQSTINKIEQMNQLDIELYQRIRDSVG